MVKSVLAAVDGSMFSRQVAQFAERIARSFGAKLAFLQVVEPLPAMIMSNLKLQPEHVKQAQLNSAQETLRSLCDDLDLRDVEQIVQLGSAPETICSEAEEHQVDLIVIGSHGHGGAPRRILGSVGSRVANLANRTVAIVRSAS